MTSLKESSDVTDGHEKEKDVAELPPSGTSLHKRRRGEPPASLSVKPQTPSDDGSSPCTAGPSLEYSWSLPDGEVLDPETLCESMLQRLKERDDVASKRGKDLAVKTKDTVEALEQLEKLVQLLDQFVTLKEHNARLLKKLRDVNHLKRLHEMYKKIEQENVLLKSETKEMQMINEAFDAELESEYGQVMFDSIMAGGRSMKRSGSKWKGHGRFGGSLLRRQRARSAGGDESDATPGTPLRRRSEGIFCKEVEKSKVSKWTKVKAAFRWEKAQWPQTTGSAVACGAMVGVVALAGSSPPGLAPERDSASLTPGSALSLTPNSSCEELREPGLSRKSVMRCDENDNTFLHAPPQDDSSTSPSPNKLHKGPWGKMRDIIQTGRESVRKKTRGSKSSPDVVPLRRRSLSDGGDSDAPPALTLTIPSSEELESEPSHPVLRKQRSLELGARPPQHRPPRASKWTKVKRAFLTSASASVPSSPNRHSAFFTDVETEGLSSGCEASGFRDEIARDYAALQTRLGREFSDRRGKLNSGEVSETEGVSSGCEASGFRDEIARDYAALQTRLGREFSDRRGKLNSGEVSETEGVSSGCEASGFRDEIARDYAALQTRLGREFSDRRGKLNSGEVSETEGVSSGCEASGFRDEIARDYAALQTRLGREFSDRRGKLNSGEVSETEGVSSGCEASGFRDEIARDYAALQTRLGREFSDRRGKLNSGEVSETEGVSSGCEASGFRDEIARDYAALQTRLGWEFSDRRGKLSSEAVSKGPARPVPTREQLSADFQKKLDEWQMLKGMQPPPFVPERKDLSEDFLKKWDAWNRMKDTNSVPSWGEHSKPDQVLVQTSTGLFKFQGISRSFTRKLHEWEKSRGIAPEASTSALLRAARARSKAARVAPAQLTRTQSDGSVAPSMASGHLHASSLSVNDAEDFESEYEREHLLVDDEEPTRGAVLVEVEAEEVCTAAPLVAVSPRPAPQQPVYSYGLAEARLLCETSSAAVSQPNEGSRTVKANGQTGAKPKTTREQSKPAEKSNRRKMARQPSIEEDAKFIRKTIEEIERGSSSRFIEKEEDEPDIQYETATVREEVATVYTPPIVKQPELKEKSKSKEDIEDPKEDKRKEDNKSNGKKKSKSRARLEREQSKPSESDTEQDVDTVTVEIPRRRKRPRRASERPRTPPTSLHSDSEGEVFVLKLKAPEPREGSPEVIVKTTRKIFSPVVRSGESVPRAVIPVDVDDLDDVRPMEQISRHTKYKAESRKANQELYARSKSSGDLQEEQRPTSRPPLPTSPSSQRKPQPKETAPSIRIMIQRYNMKISEEGHTPPSSGASSPAWRSPALERRRPPDMPVGVNIRNNPFLEREVQKSASACQLSRRDQTSVEKRLTPVQPPGLDGVLKSRSANALHPEPTIPENPLQKEMDESQETIKCNASTDTIVPDLINLPEKPNPIVETTLLRQMSEVTVPSITKIVKENPELFARSISTVETVNMEVEASQLSDRAARIRAARERFLSSPVPMRREGTSSASDLRPGDRSSRISCESDVTESQSSSAQESALGRSASTGMVNVDPEAWQRVAEGGRGERRSRSRFSLARLAARLRRKDRDEGAVSRLCRQSLLVHLPNKH